MTTYTYAPGSTNLSFWNKTATWAGGFVPNAPDADVVLPTETFASGQNYYDVDINPNETYAIRSLTDIGAGMSVGGTLNVSGAASIQSSLYLYGPSFNAGSLLVGQAATIYATSALNAGSAVNSGTLAITGATVTFGSFQNSGTVKTAGGAGDTLVVTGPAGLIGGGTLSGGTYQAGQGAALRLRGGGIVTSLAATVNLGETAAPMLNQVLSYDAASGTYRPLEATLTAIAAGGVLALMADAYAAAVPLTVAGTLTLGQASTVSGPSLGIVAGGRVTGLGTIRAPVVNNGLLGVAATAADLALAPGAVARSLVVHGPVSGGGTLQVGVGGGYGGTSTTALTLELDGSVTDSAVFEGAVGILQLDQPGLFKGSIAGFTGSDTVLLANVAYTGGTSYSYAGTASGGVLTVNAGASSIALAFTGSYAASSFALSAGSLPSSLAITATGATVNAGGGSGGTSGSGTGNGGTSGGYVGGASTVTIGGAVSYFGNGPAVGFIDGTTGAALSGGLAPIDPGGPSYLQWQFINAGTDDLAISTGAANVFIHTGSGNDAVQVTSGNNVLDGGLGSNFLTGGTGTDTFFTDARTPGVVWNTLRNFHAGDAATLFGFTAGVSSYRWEPDIAGAPGSMGATLRANIVGGTGRTGTGVDASITFTGLSVAQSKGLQIVTGTVGAGNYLYIYNPGV